MMVFSSPGGWLVLPDADESYERFGAEGDVEAFGDFGTVELKQFPAGLNLWDFRSRLE